MDEPKLNKAKVISLLVALLGLLIIFSIVLGGAALAGKKWDPSWNPFTPKIVN
ncbi:MAG: hypothetical protein Q7S10_01810 [bacterium]|nr:hypothetical protein [bacterium]